MSTDEWFAADSPLGPALATVLAHRYSYRLHEILVEMGVRATVATVYEGGVPVYRVSGSNEVDTLTRARQWIDEQDESLPAYDLHVG
jgi:hypothetical protein